jgi:hypothetical protein
MDVTIPEIQEKATPALSDSLLGADSEQDKDARFVLSAIFGFFAKMLKINNLNFNSDGSLQLKTSDIPDAGTDSKYVTQAEKQKINVIETAGAADEFLAKDGTYKKPDAGAILGDDADYQAGSMDKAAPLGLVKEKIETRAALNHTHQIAEINGLTQALTSMVKAIKVNGGASFLPDGSGLISLVLPNISNYKGYFQSAEALRAAYPTAGPGDFATVTTVIEGEDPINSIYAWNVTLNDWQDTETSSASVDLSPYVTKLAAGDDSLVFVDKTNSPFTWDSFFEPGTTATLNTALQVLGEWVEFILTTLFDTTTFNPKTPPRQYTNRSLGSSATAINLTGSESIDVVTLTASGVSREITAITGAFDSGKVLQIVNNSAIDLTFVAGSVFSLEGGTDLVLYGATKDTVTFEYWGGKWRQLNASNYGEHLLPVPSGGGEGGGPVTIPAASETQAGATEYATIAETLEIRNDRSITPKGFLSVIGDWASMASAFGSTITDSLKNAWLTLRNLQVVNTTVNGNELTTTALSTPMGSTMVAPAADEFLLYSVSSTLTVNIRATSGVRAKLFRFFVKKTTAADVYITWKLEVNGVFGELLPSEIVYLNGINKLSGPANSFYLVEMWNAAGSPTRWVKITPELNPFASSAELAALAAQVKPRLLFNTVNEGAGTYFNLQANDVLRINCTNISTVAEAEKFDVLLQCSFAIEVAGAFSFKLPNHFIAAPFEITFIIKKNTAADVPFAIIGEFTAGGSYVDLTGACRGPKTLIGAQDRQFLVRLSSTKGKNYGFPASSYNNLCAVQITPLIDD